MQYFDNQNQKLIPSFIFQTVEYSPSFDYIKEVVFLREIAPIEIKIKDNNKREYIEIGKINNKEITIY